MVRFLFLLGIGLTVSIVESANGSSAEAQFDFSLSIERIVNLPCGDCDGIALGDISGDGRFDILASNGSGGESFWFEHGGSRGPWERHLIHTLETRPREIEGNDLGDFDGDGRLEAISIDQPGGVIWLHKAGEDPRLPWRSAPLVSDRPFAQASLVTDIDGNGRPDLVYTWEGERPGRGGVHWLRFEGEDVLDPEHWHDYAMTQHESAWWLLRERIDLLGRGRPDQIVFTARNLRNRNQGARPGLFILSPPPGDPTQAWETHVVDDAVAHPLHVDFGDLNGDGLPRELVLGGFATQSVYWYEKVESEWIRHDIALPDPLNGESPQQVWNVKTYPLPGGGRDAILVPATGRSRGALLAYEYIEGRYRANPLMSLDYHHPMDDRIILADLDGAELPVALIPDSGTGVDYLRIVFFAVHPMR